MWDQRSTSLSKTWNVKEETVNLSHHKGCKKKSKQKKNKTYIRFLTASLPARGPLCGEVMVPVCTPPKRADSGVLVGTCWCCPWCPRLPVPTAGLLLGVWVCWAGPRWWKRPLSEPVPMVPSRLMERWPCSLGLLLPAPMYRPEIRG